MHNINKFLARQFFKKSNKKEKIEIKISIIIHCLEKLRRISMSSQHKEVNNN